jgi:hypothetical protein
VVSRYGNARPIFRQAVGECFREASATLFDTRRESREQIKVRRFGRRSRVFADAFGETFRDSEMAAYGTWR